MPIPGLVFALILLIINGLKMWPPFANRWPHNGHGRRLRKALEAGSMGGYSEAVPPNRDSGRELPWEQLKSGFVDI